jgi:hypothetical protein
MSGVRRDKSIEPPLKRRFFFARRPVNVREERVGSGFWIQALFKNSQPCESFRPRFISRADTDR